MKVPIKIPENVELLIQSGQTVDFRTPFMKRKGRKRMEVPLAHILQFQPEKIFLSLKKVIGDVVHQGDVLAEHKAFLTTKQYLSQTDGVITEVNHKTGSIAIELDSDEDLVVNCFFSGEIETINDDHIELKVQKAHKGEIEEEIMHYTGAEVYYMPIGGKFSEEDIENKFICAATFDPLDHIKFEALGACAYITSTKQPLKSTLHQIVLQNTDDFDHIINTRYPFCIVAPDNRSIYFYE